MKKTILQYLKHAGITIVLLLAVTIIIGLSIGARATFNHNSKRLNFDGEGPYVFYKNDSLLHVKYIKGNKDDGFYIKNSKHTTDSPFQTTVHFPLDSTFFNVEINPVVTSTPVIYNDHNNILAISDIESGFNTFRDFLIHNQVIDHNLHWTFGHNHLVLLGDFVDRGFSTTQVLWLIYKMEQEAKKAGGQVHFILGNHELKNMYGDHQAAALKYTFVAAMLGTSQSKLYNKNSLMGRWLASKNCIEYINGNVFVHGGLHPDVAKLDMDISEINNYLKSTYGYAPYPKPNADEKELLISSKKGICWYRGYFKENLSEDEVNAPLEKFGAKAVIVGHTLQSRVSKYYRGKVFAIDVYHPKDYHKNWPSGDSEGLLINENGYYRALADGSIVKL